MAPLTQMQVCCCGSAKAGRVLCAAAVCLCVVLVLSIVQFHATTSPLAVHLTLAKQGPVAYTNSSAATTIVNHSSNMNHTKATTSNNDTNNGDISNTNNTNNTTTNSPTTISPSGCPTNGSCCSGPYHGAWQHGAGPTLARIDVESTEDHLVESWRSHKPPAGLPNLLGPPHKRDGRWFTTIVVPETRVLVTALPKVGCTAMAQLLVLYRARFVADRKLRRYLQTGKRHNNGPHGVQRRSNPDAVKWRKSHLQHALADPEWRTMAFVRDPVARFVSAFLSKCTPGHDPVFACIFLPEELLYQKRRKDTVVQAEHWPTFDEAVGRVAAALRGGPPLRRDVHWLPQTQLGGGLTNSTGLRYYDAVVVYNAATFGTRLEQMLEFVGVDTQDAKKLLGGMRAQRMKHPEHRTHAGSSMCKLLTSQEQVDTLVKYYQDDYREFAHLGIKPPTLVELCGVELCG